MADLSTISDTDPANSEAVNQGASRIRETRDATQTSFGGADAGSGSQLSEHYLKGFHKFPSGDGTFPGLPGVPAAGNAGRIFHDTTQNRILRDTGVAWQILHALTMPSNFDAAATDSGVSNTHITITSLTANIPTDAAIIVCAIFRIAAPVVTDALRFRLRVDSSLINPGEMEENIVGGSGNHTITIYGRTAYAGVASGPRAVELQATAVTATAISMSQRLLFCLVI